MKNSLTSIHNNYAYDYFARLGGSGRYSAFMEWHPAALVIILAIGVDLTNEKCASKWADFLSPALWQRTDGLPNIIKEKLKGEQITQEMLSEFIADITINLKRMKKLHPDELMKWEQFLKENTLNVTPA